jgi:thiol:disulfide interchange protein DsbD
MATVYCLGIIGAFTVLGMAMSILFGAGSIPKLANTVVFNLLLSALLVFFAFNLLGMFEIRMPSWLLTFTASKESKGGFLGVLFMSLTFTLTSFTCTFAFAGTVLVMAESGDRLRPIIGLLAFSAAFSLPFFFLALFPSILKKLPKSGGWMNIAKVLMGLLELGAAVKFLGAADQSWNGQPAVFDFHLMIAIWAVISIGAALYLFGIFRLPHDVPTENIGVMRFVSAMAMLCFAMYLGTGLFGAQKPQGAIWKNVEAFANSTSHVGSDRTGPTVTHGSLTYSLDFERALDYAIEQNKPLFLDFTGVNCTNCRKMEQGAMSDVDIENRLGRFVRIQLFTDRVPLPDRKEAERLKEFNQNLQNGWFGTIALPSYVVIPPTRDVLENRKLILSRFEGYDPDHAKFAKFLDRGWSKWQKVQAGKSTLILGSR